MLAYWRNGDITKSLHTIPKEKAPLVDFKDDPRDQVQSTAIESEMKYDGNEDDDEEEKDENADKYEHGIAGSQWYNLEYKIPKGATRR
ncbi:hypothetical protein AARAC_003625 [Aspergillus arachidicola]|uniref:Uncharacterized protein n=1 Tax=Aspergillus arachidicola TaxID=656916 RepID=A0A2G7GBF6_9EURO|nr:hypothetical protein AARAC_003625 [Aspergillus arachidicola]